MTYIYGLLMLLGCFIFVVGLEGALEGFDIKKSVLTMVVGLTLAFGLIPSFHHEFDKPCIEAFESHPTAINWVREKNIGCLLELPDGTLVRG